MKSITIILTIGVMFALSSCSKEERWRERLSGPKTISLYQWKKLQDDGSFKTLIDTTALAELILWNNSNSSLNNVTYIGETAPAGWYYANVGVGPTRQAIGWYSDYEEDETFTFWSNDNADNRYRVTYAMEHKSNGLIHLETVYHTFDGIFFEVIEMKDAD
jgi:hypothetical protein